MAGELGLHPELLAILGEDEGDGDESDGQESEEGTSPANAEFGVHSGREEGEATTEAGTHEVVAGEDAGGVFGIGVAEVVEDAVKEQERADAEPARADDGDDPVHARATGPAEPEQANGDGEGADVGWQSQAELGLDLAVLVEFGFDVAHLVPDEGGKDDEDTNKNAEEGDTLKAQGEAVDLGEDDGEGLEPDVQQAVDQGDVHVQTQDDRLGQAQLEGPHERHHSDVLGLHFSAGQFGLAYQLFVACELAEAA